MPKKTQSAGKGRPRKSGNPNRKRKYTSYKGGAVHEQHMAYGIAKHLRSNPNDQLARDKYKGIQVGFSLLRLPMKAEELRNRK
jgi:hypothetical protein